MQKTVSKTNIVFVKIRANFKKSLPIIICPYFKFLIKAKITAKSGYFVQNCESFLTKIVS